MVFAIDSPIDRRSFLAAFGGTVLASALPSSGRAGEQLIAGLIRQTQAFPAISRRIEVISRAMLGHRYEANTLVGGPRKAEMFVVRDDRFDCVTFCETVLAAARAHDLPSFEAALRAIRYRGGVVAWHERNHDFAAWCARNVANGVCRPVTLGAQVEIRKVLEMPRALGRRSYTIAAIPSAALLADKSRLQNGDVIGFVSRRSSLDYFHTGFLILDDKRELLLRHASESHGRVVDERVDRFLAVNRPRYVTVLRPNETEAGKA
jgi:hypothetical protein